jgi:predicted amidohydrolase
MVLHFGTPTGGWVGGCCLGAALLAGIAVADLDLEALAAVREKMPIQQHRAKGRTQLAQQIC